MYKMIEDIARETDHLEGIENKKAINKLFLAQDESHLWPINGKFNITKRAIRKAQELARKTGESQYGLEYCYTLDMIIGEIVNNEGNW